MGSLDPMAQDTPIDAARPIRVVCIGAGMSGIICGVRFPQRIPNLDLTIYEKTSDVGGVWYENRYVQIVLMPESLAGGELQADVEADIPELLAVRRQHPRF